MVFRVYWDSPEPCPYLPGQVARMPLRMPTEELRPEVFDQLTGIDVVDGELIPRATPMGE